MKNRYWAALLGVVLLTSSGVALRASVSEDRTLVASRLLEEIGRAAQSYRSRQQLASQGSRAKADLAELKEQLAHIEKEQEIARANIAGLQEAWAMLEAAGVRKDHVSKADAVRRARQRTVVSLLQRRYLASLQTPVQRILSTPTNVVLERAWARDAMSMSDAVQSGRVLLPELSAALIRLDVLTIAAATLKEDIAETTLIVERAEKEMTSIRAITRDVHEQILRMQSALARIDAQLRSKSERALIEKGLLSPRDGAVHAASPDLLWPVDGPISAGFHNASYRQFFGVPHEGIDIVVPQETPVRSAAEGIVFLVRDGGELGYTYVLIGHRGGVASLYGHLFQTSVTAGQRVEAGQEIGLSGGTPGTYGAGPMTTAAHLHFEVIRDGENIDPVSVLPSR